MPTDLPMVSAGVPGPLEPPDETQPSTCMPRDGGSVRSAGRMVAGGEARRRRGGLGEEVRHGSLAAG